MQRFLSVLVLLAVASCARVHREIPTGTAMAVDNVYADPSFDHSSVQNVLLLPLDNFMEVDSVEFHRDHLTSSLIRNFGKFNYFNVFFDRHFESTSGRVIDLDTGRLDRMQLGEVGLTYNAQGLLQVSIDEFHPYPPMRMKVKASLYNADTGKRVWSFDHTFDADDAEVVNAMRLWWNSRIAGGDVRNRFEVGRIRPTVFSNFVFYTMARSYGDARIRNYEVVEEERARESEEKKEREKKRKRG